MSLVFFRPHVANMIESFEQGLVDDYPRMASDITDFLGEQYDRIIGTDHSACVIFEGGSTSDRDPYNVVIQALTPHMTDWYGGQTITENDRGFVINFRQVKQAGRALGFLILMAPYENGRSNVFKGQTFLILHSDDLPTMTAIEEGAAADAQQEAMWDKLKVTVDIETRSSEGKITPIYAGDDGFEGAFNTESINDR